MAASDQRTVLVHRRLRPLRLAFLVRPRDKKAIRRAIQISTCLWGGRFNPIVPVFRRTPKWWSERPLRSPSASTIAKGYLDAFEPDYVVPTSHGLSDGLGVAKERLLREKDVLDATSDDPIAHGVDVSELFSELYRAEYQFQRRHPREVLLPTSKEQRMRLLIAACFGEFPSEASLRYLRKPGQGRRWRRRSTMVDAGSDATYPDGRFTWRVSGY